MHVRSRSSCDTAIHCARWSRDGEYAIVRVRAALHTLLRMWRRPHPVPSLLRGVREPRSRERCVVLRRSQLGREHPTLLHVLAYEGGARGYCRVWNLRVYQLRRLDIRARERIRDTRAKSSGN